MQTVDPEDVTAQTYDELVENGLLANGWQKYHPVGYWAKEMQKFGVLLPTGNVLEIGAGGGQHAKELINLGYGYVGTDISKGLLEIAKKELPEQEFYVQSVYDLNFANREKFDGFWAAAVLLHVPKARIKEALGRIKSVLKPGGVGFISLIEGNNEGVEDEEFEGQKHQRFFSYWTEEKFSKTLRDNGYEVLEFHSRAKNNQQNWLCFFVKST